MKVTRGYCLEITEQLNKESANIIAQWIGSFTVIKNQKTLASKAAYGRYLDADKKESLRPVNDAKVAYLTKELPFLAEIPSQIRRNAGAKWLESMNAALIGLRKAPCIKKKRQKRNCYVTNELFDVQELDDKRSLIQFKTNDKKGNKSHIFAGFVVPFSKETLGKSLYLSRQGQRFYLSVTHEKTFDVASKAEIKKHLLMMDDEALEKAVVGYDLGVKQQVTASDNGIFHLKTDEIKQLEKLALRKQRYQRRYARISRANDRQQGTIKRKRTKNEKKLSVKIAKYDEKRKNILHYNSHVISKDIAESTPLVAGFENMNIANLLKAPKAKICDKTGKWLRNGRAAKKGLNKAISSVNMGQIRQFTSYKLEERGKLLLKVKTAYSSQTCSACDYVDKGNRKTRADFLCLSCGYKANADHNAGMNIKKRTITLIKSEAFSIEKTVRKVAHKRKKAHELASTGCGDNVSLERVQATVDEALKTKKTTDGSPLETPLCYANFA